MITKENLTFDNQQTRMLFESLLNNDKVDVMQFVKDNIEAGKVITMEDIKPLCNVIRTWYKIVYIPVYKYSKWV